MTDVVFLRDTEVFAVFPGIQASVLRKDALLYYTHIGQHGRTDIDYCLGCEEVTKPSEYAELFEELERIGYELYVISKKRMTDDKYRVMRFG